MEIRVKKSFFPVEHLTISRTMFEILPIKKSLNSSNYTKKHFVYLLVPNPNHQIHPLDLSATHLPVTPYLLDLGVAKFP